MDNYTDPKRSLEFYEITMFDLQHQISVEKNKKKPNYSVLGFLRYKLNKVHDNYCILYLKKYEL